MEITDIRNASTPISVGAIYPSLCFWRHRDRPYARSTPISDCSSSDKDSANKPSKFRLNFESSFLDFSFSPLRVSPVFPQPMVNPESVPVFGRKLSLESDNLSTTGVATTLRKMEICDYNYGNNNEILHDIKNKADTEESEENTSSFDANEQFKKQIKKNKNRKSVSPKHKNLKVYKVGLARKIISPTGAKKKLISASKKKASADTAKKNKSPKNKSPKVFKAGSSKLITNAIRQGQQKNTTAKQKVSTETSHQATGLIKKSPIRNGSQCSTLKSSKCFKAPQLHTAARAAFKKYKEQMRKEKEKELEEYKNKLLEEQKRREEEELQKLRQQTVFKAKPIRKYAPLPSVKKRPLTDPISPNLCKRRRIESSSQNSHSHRSDIDSHRL